MVWEEKIVWKSRRKVERDGDLGGRNKGLKASVIHICLHILEW